VAISKKTKVAKQQMDEYLHFIKGPNKKATKKTQNIYFFTRNGFTLGM
jgi:hypothetical protein